MNESWLWVLFGISFLISCAMMLISVAVWVGFLIGAIYGMVAMVVYELIDRNRR